MIDYKESGRQRNVYLIFYNRTQGLARYLLRWSKYKHVDLLIVNNNGAVYLEMAHGLVNARVINHNANELIDRLRRQSHVTDIIGLTMWDAQYKHRPFLSLLSTCSDLARRAAGLDIDTCITPKSLHRKLFKLDGKRNYKLFYAQSLDK